MFLLSIFSNSGVHCASNRK